MGSVPGKAVAAKSKKKRIAKKKAIVPKRKMKTLHWKPIADKKIVGTIWETVTKIEDEIVAERAGDAFFAPKAEEKKEGDTAGAGGDDEKKKEEAAPPQREPASLEELFGAKPKRKKKAKGKGGATLLELNCFVFRFLEWIQSAL